MATLSLQRTAPTYVSTLSSYRMTLTITSSEIITPFVFVKQRLSNLDKTSFDDVFAAIATPSQLAELQQLAPNQFSSYFLDKTVTLIGRTVEYLDWIYNEILNELNKLVLDYDLLQTYASEETVNLVISGAGVTELPYTPQMPTITLTPIGASPTITIDPTATAFYIVSLALATGTPVLTFTNLAAGQRGSIEIRQPSSSNLNITFPTNSLQGRGGSHTYTGAGSNTTDLINWSYDGTNILFDADEGYS
jgi:hypothetical protein